MAKKKKARKAAKPAKSKRPAAKAKKTKKAKKAKKAVVRKVPKRKAAKKAKRPVAKKAAQKAAKRPAAKARKAKTGDVIGEGNYTASRNFRNEETAFIRNNREEIARKAKEAERALDGPEGDELRRADEESGARGQE
jgi:hypothetical protein